jgi:Cd2+/Zn2+-exporting ATPase
LVEVLFMSLKQKKILIRILLAVVVWIGVALLPLEGWGSLVAFTVPYAIVGYDILWSAARNILRGQVFDERFLMALATLGAFALGEYFEAVAVMLFYQVGELFQSIAVGKSRRSIAALMDIRPDCAMVIRNGEEVEVFPDEVDLGEIILVRPGEKIPLDGVVYSGQSSVDTSALTGESAPRPAEIGAQVLSGSVNLSGLLHVEVTKRYEDCAVAKILEMVEDAAIKKARAERFITRFAKYYTPCVVLGAVLLAVVPSLLIGNWSEWLRRALIFLVVSCPCALVISVPLSFFGGIGGASRKGILIKGGTDLEALSKVRTVVFDKTGTLTAGRFEVAEVLPVGMEKEQLLEWAALAEYHSNHPIALSIKAAYPGEMNPSRAQMQKELPGYGISAVIDGKNVFIGNEKWMQEHNVTFKPFESLGTIVYLAIEGTYVGCIVLADQIKKDAKEAIFDLKKVGVERVVMLSGDLWKVAQAVGVKLGLDDVKAELLPHQKVEKLEEILSKKDREGTLAFVGDGINDAPVLMRADVGIAMGALGSDAAIEAADVVLMDDQLKKLPEGIRIAKKTMKIVRQNILFSLAVKGGVLLLGALGVAGIWLAVFADVGVMVLAILNAMRCLK